MNKTTVDKNSRVDCLLCGASVPLIQMRAHTGWHIIHRLYGMNESGLKREVCGLGNATCNTNNAFRPVTMRVGFVAGANAQQS